MSRKMAAPCDCRECATTPPPTTRGEHGYSLETVDQYDNPSGPWFLWRWRCACGSRGRWTAQSDNAAFHAWLRHIGIPEEVRQ